MGRRIAIQGILMLALTVCAVARDKSPENAPPSLDKGWNLIASPCDVAVDQLKQRLGADGFQVFAWDGEAYVPVDRLERGRGYALNSNAVLSTS